MSKLPSLTAVRYFAVAARYQNFTLAAQELNVTQGAVSRMVQVLEEDLGMKLFDRNGRWITLTDAGGRYYRQVERGLQIIQTASEQIRLSSDQLPLTLVTNAGFASLWLVPHLADFHRRYPDIQVEIVEDDKQASSTDEGHATLGIRYGLPPWPGVMAQRLPLGPQVGVVAAPSLWDPSIQTPGDLLDSPLLVFTSDRRNPWQEYFEHFQLDMPSSGHMPRFARLLTLREAAISGLGYALVPLFLFEADIREERLIQAIPHVITTQRGYYLTFEKGIEKDRKARLFINWLLKKIQNSVEESADGHGGLLP